MESIDQVSRHLGLAETLLTDAGSDTVSLPTRMTAVWNAGLQVALAYLVRAGRRPVEEEWEGAAERTLVAATGGAGMVLAEWARRRYDPDVPLDGIDVDLAVALVERWRDEVDGTAGTIGNGFAGG